MQRLVLDVRLAMRELLRASSFTTLAVILLAVGIGGATAVFSVLNVIYYRPLPYPNADRLAILGVSLRNPKCAGRCKGDPPPAIAEAWRTQADFLENVGSIAPVQTPVRTAAGVQVLEGVDVDEGALRLLAPHVALGRGLTPGDFAPDAPKVVVLSQSGWRDVFGGDSAVIGRRVSLRSASYTIVGVLSSASELAPPLFSLNVPTAQFWIAHDTSARAGSSISRTIALVRNGADLNAVRHQLDDVLARTGQRNRFDATVQSLRDTIATRYHGSFWYLLAAVALLLGVACLNVGGLFLARFHNRTPELATRVALGGTRWDIGRYLLIEAMLVSAAGGIGGTALAYFGANATRLLPARQLPAWVTVSLDWRVLAAAVALSVACTVVMAIGPLVALSPEQLLVRFRERSVTHTGRSMSRLVFVSAQIALSLVLLTAAGSVTRVLLWAEFRDMGMARHSLIYVLLQPTRDAGVDAPRFTTDVLNRLRNTPGIAAASAEGFHQARDYRTTESPAAPDGQMIAEGADAPFSDAIAPRTASEVATDYFATMGIKILKGRSFTNSDVASGTPVAILDEPTALHLFPNGSALGRRIKFGGLAGTDPWLTIVGVSAEVRASPLDPDSRYVPQLYRPLAQFPAFPTSLVVKVSRESASLEHTIRRAVADANPSVAVVDVLSVEQSLGLRLWQARFNAAVLAAFALIALFVASYGAYAAVSYLVSTRRRELAIRMAIGATHTAVVNLMLRSALVMIVPGVAIGIAGYLAVARVLKSLLYGVSAFDPYVILVAAISLSAASLLASWMPARAASRIEPSTLLK